MGCDVDQARNFIYANARLLERRVYAVLFENGAVDAVIAAVAPYQNADGGFGHALEPDKRAPASQPLDVEIAFERLASVDARSSELMTSACDWLATVAAPSGAVQVLMPSHEGFPRADHWLGVSYEPHVNPTAGIVARAHQLGVTHPWVDQATEFCFAEIEVGRPTDEAHALLGLSRLIEHAPDRDRAQLCSDAIATAIETARFMNLDPTGDGYGLTPLDFVPTPTSVAAEWFDAELIAAHLDLLESEQHDDGGWPIAWDPPGDAGRSEWRGIKTVDALRILRAHGRTA